ncbi:trypco2 family protein [Streptomyces dubilierae]|uniref:trypco2 family protein n=1 Tax=Streptomyces dubilierae TaxID=3075533 RepID=UPI00374E01A6
MTTDGQDGLELGEAIEAVRRGLEWAAAQGDGHALRFTAESVQLEFALELRRSGAAGGGVKAWVVSMDGRSERGSTSSQRITVCLRANDVPISSRGPAGVFGPDPVAGDHHRGI